MTPHLNAGTGKINGPSHTYDWDTRGGSPGNNIQPIGQSNDPGIGNFTTRDNHEHEGVHGLESPSGPLIFGDIALLPGYNIQINQIGQNIEISQERTCYGSMYYDAGPCAEEIPLEISNVGTCDGGTVIIQNLVGGSAYDVIPIPLLGMFIINTSGTYKVMFDISCFYNSEDSSTQLKVSLYNGASLPPITYAKAMAQSYDSHETILSGHGIFNLSRNDNLFLGITALGQNPESVFITHLQFTIIMIGR